MPLSLAFASACTSTGAGDVGPGGSSRFDHGSWDDGMAVVLVYEGRLRRYGVWREARVRDYLVREYLDASELTKRDLPASDLIRVLKANRMIEFSTGSYDYQLGSSLFFRRDSTGLVKGVGSCINACGIVFQRWDARSGQLVWDSYWEGEGRSVANLTAGTWRFADELPFVGGFLPPGDRITVMPPLASPRAMVHRPGGDTPFVNWLGVGDVCLECSPGSAPSPIDVPAMAETLGEPKLPAAVLRVEHDGRRTRFYDERDALALELAHDEHGFLESWELPGEQQFRRVATYRGAYWERTDPEHESILKRP